MGDPTPQCSVLARGEGHVGPVRARAVRRDGRRGPAWEGVPPLPGDRAEVFPFKMPGSELRHEH